MKDTSAGMERKFREIVLERSGEERLKMGCSMHAVARALVKVSIPKGIHRSEPGVVPAVLQWRV